MYGAAREQDFIQVMHILLHGYETIQQEMRDHCRTLTAWCMRASTPPQHWVVWSWGASVCCISVASAACITVAAVCGSVLQIISAFEVPKMLYDSVRKCFYRSETTPKLLGSAEVPPECPRPTIGTAHDHACLRSP